MGRHVVGIHYHDNRWVSKVFASDPLVMCSRPQASSRYPRKRRGLELSANSYDNLDR